jgi:antitoxin ParD1/3/4
MNVHVARHFEVWIEDEIASGRYASAEQLIEDSLRLLEQREARVRDMRAAIQEGLDSGPAEPWEGAEAIILRARAAWDAERSQGRP